MGNHVQWKIIHVITHPSQFHLKNFAKEARVPVLWQLPSPSTIGGVSWQKLSKYSILICRFQLSKILVFLNCSFQNKDICQFKRTNNKRLTIANWYSLYCNRVSVPNILNRLTYSDYYYIHQNLRVTSKQRLSITVIVTKAPHYWPFLRGNYQRAVDSSHTCQ